MRKPIRIEPSERPDCAWFIYRDGTRIEQIDPQIAERDRIAMKKLYQEKSGDYSY
jgi:hypothetical protein